MLWKRRKDEIVVALDIGTEFVKAVLLNREGRKGHIIGVGRVKQNLGDMKSGIVMDLGSVVENSEEALEIAFKQTRKHEILGVILGMAGESVKGIVTKVHCKRSEPEEEIKIAELKNIVQKLQWDSFTTARKEIANEIGSPEIDIKLVSSGIVGAEIDGIRVTNPLGFVGKQITLSVFTSFAPLLFYQALRNVVNSLRLPLIDIAATPFAICSSLSFESGDDGDAIFIDVGGGTTDIAITKHGGIVGQKSFAIGGRAFTKKIMADLNLSFTESEKVKIEYSSGKLTSQSEKIVKKAFRQVTEIWLTGTKMSLEEFDIEILPSRIVLCGGGVQLPEIQKAIEEEKFIEDLSFASKPKVRLAKSEEITNIKDDFEKIDSSQYLICLALGDLALRESVESDFILENIWQNAFRNFRFKG